VELFEVHGQVDLFHELDLQIAGVQRGSRIDRDGPGIDPEHRAEFRIDFQVVTKQVRIVAQEAFEILQVVGFAEEGFTHARRGGQPVGAECMAERGEVLLASLNGGAQHLLSDMFAEAAVGLELGFVEELVRGRFVGKGGVTRGVVLDVRRLVPGQRGFEIDQGAGGGVGIHFVVANHADGVVATAGLGVGGPLDLVEIQFDVDSQIDADLPDGVAEIFKVELRVTPGIHHEDAVTAAQDHFVQAEIFEMPAVGEVDVGMTGVREAEGFGQQGADRDVG